MFYTMLLFRLLPFWILQSLWTQNPPISFESSQKVKKGDELWRIFQVLCWTMEVSLILHPHPIDQNTVTWSQLQDSVGEIAYGPGKIENMGLISLTFIVQISALLVVGQWFPSFSHRTHSVITKGYFPKSSIDSHTIQV